MSNEATCKTCGASGPPWVHIPSIFDPEGRSAPGHKIHKHTTGSDLVAIDQEATSAPVKSAPSTPPPSLDTTLRAFGIKEFWNGYEATDEDKARDYAPSIDNVKSDILKSYLPIADVLEIIGEDDNSLKAFGLYRTKAQHKEVLARNKLRAKQRQRLNRTLRQIVNVKGD